MDIPIGVQSPKIHMWNLKEHLGHKKDDPFYPNPTQGHAFCLRGPDLW